MKSGHRITRALPEIFESLEFPSQLRVLDELLAFHVDRNWPSLVADWNRGGRRSDTASKAKALELFKKVHALIAQRRTWTVQ